MRDGSSLATHGQKGKGRLVEATCLAAAIRLVARDAENSDLNKPSEKKTLVGIA